MSWGKGSFLNGGTHHKERGLSELKWVVINTGRGTS